MAHPRVSRLLASSAAGILALAAVWLWSGRPVHYGTLAAARADPDSSPNPTYRIQKVTLSTTTGRRLVCSLRTPQRPASPPQRYALLVAGGRRTGRRAVLFVDSAFVGVAIACDYAWADLVLRRGPRFLLSLPAIRAELLATPEALGLVASYLAARPEADRTCLVALGASLGAPFAAAWASTDQRPCAVALLYGGGELDRIFELNLRGDIRWPWLRRRAASALAAAIRPLEPTRTVARIAPRPVIVVGAAGDQWVPQRSVESLYAAAREPKRLVWLRGAHIRTRDAALLETLTDTVRVWLDSVIPRPQARAPVACAGAAGYAPDTMCVSV